MTTTPQDPKKEILRLQVTHGPDKGRRLYLKPQGRVLIGRGSGAELQVTDSSVSTKHCLIRYEGGLVVIEDLNSRNGTKLNGATIKTCALDEDARLEVGRSVIALAWVETETEAPSGVEAASSSAVLPREDSSLTMRLPRSAAERIADSVFMSTEPLQEFRKAQGLVGKTLDAYKLVEMVGMGPLGYVYRVQDPTTQEEGALKLIPRPDVRSPELLARFLNGCRKDLRVPGATRLLATGETEDFAYVVMEYARGRSLQALLDDAKTLTPAEAVNMAVSLCDTLHAAHALGVFHCDIKPASIILCENSTPVLLDLGLSRRVDAEGRGLMRKDERLGNLVAAAPELTQDSSSMDARTDVYSLAATLFYAMSGQPPLAAPTRAEYLREIRSETPPRLNTLLADAPQALSEVLARALEKEPARRFSNMLDFAAALKQAVPSP